MFFVQHVNNRLNQKKKKMALGLSRNAGYTSAEDLFGVEVLEPLPLLLFQSPPAACPEVDIEDASLQADTSVFFSTNRTAARNIEGQIFVVTGISHENVCTVLLPLLAGYYLIIMYMKGD